MNNNITAERNATLRLESSLNGQALTEKRDNNTRQSETRNLAESAMQQNINELEEVHKSIRESQKQSIESQLSTFERKDPRASYNMDYQMFSDTARLSKGTNQFNTIDSRIQGKPPGADRYGDSLQVKNEGSRHRLLKKPAGKKTRPSSKPQATLELGPTDKLNEILTSNSLRRDAPTDNSSFSKPAILNKDIYSIGEQPHRLPHEVRKHMNHGGRNRGRQVGKSMDFSLGNYKNAQMMMGGSLVANENTNTLKSRATKERQVKIKSTFQPPQKQRESSHHTFEIKDPLQIGPKQFTSVPKNLVLYKISQNLDSIQNESTGMLSPNLRSTTQMQGGKVFNRISMNAASLNEFMEQHRQQTTMINKSHQLFDPNQFIQKEVRNLPSSNLFDKTEASVGINQPSRLPSMPTNIAQSLNNFQITDLLEMSLEKNQKEKADKKMRQVIEIYKRQIKDDNELNNTNEIMIKNYRLYVVRDPVKEGISEDVRSLFETNKGTTISVSNSIVKPDMHRFSTLVTDALTTAYPELNETSPTRRNNKFMKPHKLMTASMQSMSVVEEQTTEAPIKVIDATLDSKTFTLNEDLFISKEDFTSPQFTSYEGSSQLNLGMNRPLTPYDQSEVEAASMTNNTFEKWLRNVFSAKSEHRFDPPTRYVMENGKKATPTIKDINWHIAIDYKTMTKDRPQPVDEHIATKKKVKEPYKHLQMLIINQDVKEWYHRFALSTMSVRVMGDNRKPLNTELINMGYKEIRAAIEFARAHLSNIDRVLVNTRHIPLELFIDFEDHIKPLIKKVKLGAQQNRLNPNYLGVPAYTNIRFLEGPNETIRVFICDFSATERKFQVISKEHKINTWRSITQLFLEGEDAEKTQATYDEIRKHHAESMQFARVQHLIYREMLKRYPFIQLQDKLLLQIQAKIGVNLLSQDPNILKKLIIQVEALYVFAIFKSVLYSQRKDPFIKGLLYNFKIPTESTALRAYQTKWWEKPELQGVPEFDLRRTKVDLDNNSIVLMDEKFIKIPELLHKLTQQTIGQQKLFRFPFDLKVLKLKNHTGSDFKKISEEDLNSLVNEFPLSHHQFVLASKVTSTYFQHVAKYQWSELVSRKIDAFIGEEFDFNQADEITPEQIDPCLNRLLAMIKQFMQTVLFDAYEVALKDYVVFLLSFILRDKEVRDTEIIDEVRYNKWIQLELNQKRFDPSKGILLVNDTELIPLQHGPMVKVSAEIEDFTHAVNLSKRQKIITTPQLDVIGKELFSIIQTMHGSLHNVDRIEGLIFPLLHLSNKTLVVPDVHGNERVTHYVNVLERLIETALKATKKMVKHMNKFMYIFKMKTDIIIPELKKQTYQMLQDKQQAEEEEQERKSAPQIVEEQVEEQPTETPANVGSDDQAGANLTTPEETKQIEPSIRDGTEIDNSSITKYSAVSAYKPAQDNADEDGEEDSGDEDETAKNDVAYKSQEIDKQIMHNELNRLREIKWEVQETTYNFYDFGLLHLDCQKYKKRLLHHCQDLIDTLENFNVNEFMSKMNIIQIEIENVSGKLELDAKSIDDVIMLLDYIETLKQEDNKIDDIHVLINALAVKMEYIEWLQIIFKDDTYYKFLELRIWPIEFKEYIETRKAQLMSMKASLFDEMNNDIDGIFEQIEKFRGQMEGILNEGLVEANHTWENKMFSLNKQKKSRPSISEIGEEQEESEEEIEEPTYQSHTKINTASKDENALPPIPVTKWSGNKNYTFFWLADELGLKERRFDTAKVEEVYYKLEVLKGQFDEVEELTHTINKREQLLMLRPTSFQELFKIQDDLKPLHELWDVSMTLARTLPSWVEGKFEDVDPTLIEIRVEEWHTELRRLEKTNLINEFPKQKEFMNFMKDALNQTKNYFQMIRQLRTKGLGARHWRMLGEKLGFNLDPNEISLHSLIMLELYEPENLKTIKEVCEVATKEYAVQTTLSVLDKDIKSAEFVFEYLPDGVTSIVTMLPELIAQFEDYFLRISVLKTNPHIKSFVDKLVELEKTIKTVVDQVNEWAAFQRNFIYLYGIFSLEEMRKSMPSESGLFRNIKTIFVKATQEFKEYKEVHRITSKDNFLNVLVKGNADCEIIRKSLVSFLEKKRGKFPRLFFLSNEELIDIFGKGSNLVQHMVDSDNHAFVQTMFEGVNKLKFNKLLEITHMKSKEGEEIELVHSTPTGFNVDNWLTRFEQSMVNTLKDQFFASFRNQDLQSAGDWIRSYPGQAVYLTSHIWFNLKIQAIFKAALERDNARSASKEKKGSKDQTMEASEESQDVSDDDEGARSPKREVLADDGEETDSDFLRAYTEELFRQIKKDEVQQPDKAQLEKVLRLKQRFRVNRNRSAFRSFQTLSRNINDSIISFTEMVRTKLPVPQRLSTVALLVCHVHFRDIVKDLITNQVENKDEFKWQIQIKFNVTGLNETIYDSAFKDGSSFKTEKINVDFEVFNMSQKYGFEYLGNCPRLVVTPLTERCQRSLLTAMQYHYGGAPEGPFGTGKTETTKDLSRQIAKICFVMNCSANFEFAGVCRFFKGLAASGAWCCFDEFNRMEPMVLSMISTVIINLQQAIKKGEKELILDESTVVLKRDCAVFITLNPGYAGRQELPMNLKALFRPISMVVPDSRQISEILLYSSGFIGAEQLALKIVNVQSLANDIMKKTKIQHDFGLRSIKAIITAAQKLKLQVQGIEDCELSEIIEDSALSDVHYKSEIIVQEIMDLSQTVINNQVEANMVASGLVNSSNQNSMISLGSDVMNIQDQGSIRATNETEPDQQNEDNENRILAPGQQRNALFRQVWKGVPYKSRQRDTVYKQIGIDPSIAYSEEELEEYIILKAVRDYNHSKFALDDHVIIEGIIKDVFQNAVPDLDAPIQDYAALQECILSSFKTQGFDYSSFMNTKILQFYEVLRSKHGCILMGDHQAGKTTLINLLMSALNKAALNEYMLAVQDLRKAKMMQLCKDYEEEQIQEITDVQAKEAKQALAGDFAATAKKRNKKTEQDALKKKTYEDYKDLWRQSQPTQEELDVVRSQLSIQGVEMRRINPKGMTIDEMFGFFDEISHEHQEGLFTQEFRHFSVSNENKKKKWILFDGPIDFDWVENLNSILDDNKKMSLPSGEQIALSDSMALLLESDNMQNITPATVSRCGLICMQKDDCCNSKAIFNKWIRNLTPNLKEFIPEIESTTNFLMVEALAVYEEEQATGKLAFSIIDMHWIMQNFTRLLTALVYDYFVDYEMGYEMNMAIEANRTFLGKSLLQMSVKNTWVDNEVDPNVTAYMSEQMNRTQQKSGGSSRAFKNTRVETPDVSDRIQNKMRMPKCCFLGDDLRNEHALKSQAIWLEAFIIFALVWTFNPILSENGRKQLDERLKAKFEIGRTEYSYYQREKKRKDKEKIKLQKEMKKSKIKVSTRNVMQTPLTQQTPNTQTQDDESKIPMTADGLTFVWTDDLSETPMLISNFPEGQSFYDYFFCLDTSEWKKFDVQGEMDSSRNLYNMSIPSQKKIENLFVPSIDNIRHAYILECLVTRQQSAIVIGPGCSGRSALVRNLLFDAVNEFSKKLQTEHITMSSHSTCTAFKANVESFLEYKQSKDSAERVFKPPKDNKIICYIQDVHLAMQDKFHDQGALEAIRDYLTTRSWVSARKRKIKTIQDMCFFGDMAMNHPDSDKVSGRMLHHFNYIVLNNFSIDSFKIKTQVMVEMVMQNWSHSLTNYAQPIVNSLVEITRKVFKEFKPTPMKSHYTFNWRDMTKIIFSLQMIDSNSVKTQPQIISLLYHECMRTFGDRILMSHDKKTLMSILNSTFRQNFTLPKLPPKVPLSENPTKEELAAFYATEEKYPWEEKDPDQLFFSKWNQDIEGCYMEIRNVNTVQSAVESCLERFNDSNERVKIDLYLYNQLNRHMIKIFRILSTANGHVLNIAMKGFGMTNVVNLVSFAAGHQFHTFETYQGYGHVEWHNDLKAVLIQCAVNDKPATLFLDEFKLLDLQWFNDLECLLKNNISTETIKKSDFCKIVQQIYREVEKEKKGVRLGLNADEIKKEKLLAESRKDKDEEAKEKEVVKSTSKMLQKYPQIQAEYQKIVLNRIKSNFHLVLQYSPTGQNFREKLCRNKELMYLSQMVFMDDLPMCELEQLGTSFLDKQAVKEIERLQVLHSGFIPEADELRITEEREEKERIMKCAVGMYYHAVQVADKLTDENGQRIYLTPAHFLRMFDYHELLLKEKQHDMDDQIAKYHDGLKKLKETQHLIHDYHIELGDQEPELIARVEHIQRVVSEIEEEFDKIKKKRENLKSVAYDIETKAHASKEVKMNCENTINKLIPTLNQAINSIDQIEKSDIAQLRSMNKPPKSIKIALKILCIFMEIPPADKVSKKTGIKKKSYWRAAQSRQLLGNPALPRVLLEFDRNKISFETMMKVEDEILDPNFSYEKAYSASRAATGIFKWIKFTRDYFYIFKEIEPRRDAYFQSQKQFDEKFAQLEKSKVDIVKLDDALKSMKDHQVNKDQVIEQLQQEAKDCLLRKTRADKLIRRLQSEKHKWMVCIRQLSQRTSTLGGDIVLASGFISVLGGFSQKGRTRCINYWSKDIFDQGFDTNKDFDFTELFGDSAKIRRWHGNLLPTDNMSISNAILLEKSVEFTMLLDPQYQGVTWVKKQQNELGDLILLHQNDESFVKVVELAMDMGKTIIVDQIGDQITLNLKSIMKRKIVNYGGQNLMNFQRKNYKYDPAFKLIVVCMSQKPKFDINVTNYVTLINFAINIQSLTTQLLNIIVKNERHDLEQHYNESSKEAYDSVNNLKGIQDAILIQLNKPVPELLGGEDLIRTLNESQAMSEYTSSKLRDIQQLREQIDQARGDYLKIAQRAAILFFVLQEMSQIRSIYSFPLNWYREIFFKSVEMTNICKPDHVQQKKQEAMDAKGRGEEVFEDGQSQARVLTKVDRVDLLVQTITQESFKRIQYSIYEKDRMLIQYMIALKVLQAEESIEPNLFDFFLNGPKHVDVETEVPFDENCPKWMTKVVWADLCELAKLKPFNEDNLLKHIKQHRSEWSIFRNEHVHYPCFTNMPSRQMINFNFFNLANSTQQLKKMEAHELNETTSNNESESREEKTANQTRGGHSHMKRTESEILNDPEIWAISSSEDEEDTMSNLVKLEVEENKNDLVDESEQELARYLVESCPGAAEKKLEQLEDLQTSAQKLFIIQKREAACQSLAELCILRCIRPEMIDKAMDKFVSQVVDPYYNDFRKDILNDFLAERKVYLPGEQPSTTPRSNVPSSRKKKEVEKAVSRTIDKQSSVLTPSSQMPLSDGEHTIEEEELPQVKMLKRKINYGSIEQNLTAAFGDSDPKIPILMLLTNACDTTKLVSDFLRHTGYLSCSVKHYALFKGSEELVENQISLAIEKGDWIILESLHLVESWLPALEQMIQRWRNLNEMNPRFRLWITCVPGQELPTSILQSSVKIAIQEPDSVKQQILKMQKITEKEYNYRKSQRNVQMHRNLTYALMYFHSIVSNRKNFGITGWNVPYKFDFSDFEVSCAQLMNVLKPQARQPTNKAVLQLLRYFVSNINYAGKIQRPEDQTTLNAILSDLLTEKNCNVDWLSSNKDKSHYGFPREEQKDDQYCQNYIPDEDEFQFFGFNQAINISVKIQGIKGQLSELGQFNQHAAKEFHEKMSEKTSVGVDVAKICLRQLPEKQIELKKMIKEQDSIICLITRMQKLLVTSSLDKRVLKDTSRYDHNVAQPNLPQRDKIDMNVTELGNQLVKAINDKFPYRDVLKKFPIKYKDPINNIVNKEIGCYRVLLQAISSSVEDLVANVDGKYPRPHEIEELWYNIQVNKVPEKWRKVAFQSANGSLADFLVSLNQRLEFWNGVVSRENILDTPEFWLPAFYSPKSLLHCLSQTRSRNECISIDLLSSYYEVQSFYEAKEPTKTPNSIFLSGFWLEGAEYDLETKLIVEQSHGHRFVQFPVIKLTTVHRDSSPNTRRQSTRQVSQATSQVVSPTGVDSPGKFMRKQGLSIGKLLGSNSLIIRAFQCPVYKSTLRLSSANLMHPETQPVEFIRLMTYEQSVKWIKRGVALILERTYDY